MQSLARGDLTNTLRAWHEFINDIESRMPAVTTARDNAEYLLDGETAQALGLSGFRLDFLTAARRPRFRFIAPGLDIFNGPGTREID
jgi:hypothetical protein